MPPIRFLEDYLELIEAVEEAADALQTPVLIEGYKPPTDHRLLSFQITPDPGVVEVKISPHRLAQLDVRLDRAGVGRDLEAEQPMGSMGACSPR